MDLQRWTSSGAPSEPELFNWLTALPASLWRELLGDANVSITIVIEGSFRVCADRGPGGVDVLFEGSGDTYVPGVPLGSAEMVWIDVENLGGIREVVWSTDLDIEIPGVIAVVPTFQRESDATHQAATFLRSEFVHRVVVIDQGGTLGEYLPFHALLNDHPERLVLIEQGNFGGSGGYARGMLESLADPDCAVLLSDDDAALPHESLRRMLVAQSLAARVGRRLVMATPMFSAEDPAKLISAAERVDARIFQWGAADGLRAPISVDAPPFDVFDAMAVRETPNYAGWWGALLPPGMVSEVGLPAPFFLKWDDAEYGLRATKRGYEFMALPGTGVWHPTWGAHKTLTTWVAVLLHRNRLATASAYGAGRGVIRDSFVHQIKHIASLQYAVAGLWAAGIDQFLEGPDWLGSDLRDARSAAQVHVDENPSFPPNGDLPSPEAPLGVAAGLIRAFSGLFRGHGTMETTCAASAFTWRDGLGMDRVVLTDEGGAPVTELRRDARRARSAVSRAVRQHCSLVVRWREKSPRYARALEQSITEEYWRDVLGIRE